MFRLTQPETVNSNRTSNHAARAWLLAIVLLVAGLTSDLPGRAAGAYGGGAGSGDAVGSLPGTYGGPGEADARTLAGLPVLVLRGTPAELARVVADAGGSGFVEQIALDDGTVEFRFHGNASVWLDKGALALSSVTVRVDIGATYGTHVSKIKYDGLTVSRAVRAAVDMPLALSAMLNLPKISSGAQVSLVLSNTKHVKQVIGIQDVGVWVRLDQRY
ncbi:MAG: hypothetical protein L6Q99_10030 [Planctomycetes bacterium]|nr:hypothetical protein [Planctomycetota bacterium]